MFLVNNNPLDFQNFNKPFLHILFMKREELIEDKSGQFYLIAAIIISVIVLGLFTMSNYSRRQETIRNEKIGEELKIESEKVLDFGTSKGYNENQILDLMENFSRNYIDYVQEGIDFYFLFGNSNKIRVIGHAQESKIIDVNFGSGKSSMNLNSEETLSNDFTPTSNTIILTIDEADYNFVLKDGENFYFVVSQDIGGEKHVVRN